ncbi:chemotaxis response regulator protein-glutamate methylesterase [Stutzerimonas nosocomialis]|uniref:protein-glutamate methylesterase/protein-glutamine glutaminase n=1 Tax=Stutzerimonas nosocomialis TaxID=1056496 RepID=UPI00110861EA|nr:chemotaxis response regulator protein-glutamate methylesterase [Stutzerimonas nosocomialis]TLX54422.1 chemotaxis response regulator protein-glutamate methylesterase [Stutzerimonas nosocomialis]
MNTRAEHDEPIEVFIVDPSALARQTLAGCINGHRQMTVIGQASDPLFALEKMKKRWPDVLVLDLQTPRMNGLAFLRKLMAERPTPVIICSALGESDTTSGLEALAAGAVSVLAKARLGVRDGLQQLCGELLKQIEIAARSQPQPMIRPPRAQAAADEQPPLPPEQADSQRLVAIGASTGGTQALERVICELDTDCPGLVIVQHMPARFTTAFAQRLNNRCRIEVREACHQDQVRPGVAFIAPGGLHTAIRRHGARILIDISEGPPVNHHKPSVDVLFESAAHCMGPDALGIIMTGMGHDGAQGLLAMRAAGASTLAQDEASCVVYGMPKEALRLGAAQQSAGLEGLAQAIRAFGRGGGHPAPPITGMAGPTR